jgi:hypothetical protein
MTRKKRTTSSVSLKGSSAPNKKEVKKMVSSSPVRSFR